MYYNLSYLKMLPPNKRNDLFTHSINRDQVLKWSHKTDMCRQGIPIEKVESRDYLECIGESPEGSI